MDTGWNPWNLTTLALALVMATALVAGLVVANWSGLSPESQPRRSVSAVTRPASPPRSAKLAAVPAVPPQYVVEACNRQATAEVGDHDKTQEIVKDAAIGVVVGASVGVAGGAVAAGGKGAGKGVAIGGVAGAGGGTLYGLDENRENDEKFRAAYSNCMRSRGYTAG